MKKILSIITAALAAGVFATTSISASACGSRHGANACHTPAAAGNFGWNAERASIPAANAQSSALHYFIDINNDGICDNCSVGICLPNGLCSNCYHGYGNFFDNNGDGICDNCANGVCRQHGIGYGYYNINGNFIDNNNDGICDNCADGVCRQHGIGLSRHHQKGCHR